MATKTKPGENDMTTAAFAASIDREASTIRRACIAGRVPGAYKVGDGNRATWFLPLAAQEHYKTEILGRPGRKPTRRPAS